MLVLGACRSILTAGLLASVWLSALSLTEALAVRPMPSPVIVLSTGSATTPDNASAAVQWMVTSPLYQPAAFDAVVGAPLSDGAVSSTLMPLSLTLAVLPAASATVRLTLWLAPSPNVCVPGQISIPDGVIPAAGDGSLQVKLRTTSALYQPFALGARSRATLIVGAVLSVLTVGGSVARLPALSNVMPVTGWSLPSVVTSWSVVQLATPDRLSAQRKCTVTLVLFQPLPLAAGDWVWPMVGEVVSIL